LYNQPSNYFEINDVEYANSFISQSRPNGKLLDGDLFRRDGHSGRLRHLFWKQEFQKEIDRLGLFND
jgi:hypothetical protein